jgi:hypothetical protein
MIEDEENLDYQRELHEEKVELGKKLEKFHNQFVNWRANFPNEFDIWNGDSRNAEIVNKYSPKLEIWQKWKINREEEDKLIEEATPQLSIIKNLIYSDAIFWGFNQFLHDLRIGRLCRIIDEWKETNQKCIDEFNSFNIDNWSEYDFYLQKDEDYKTKILRSRYYKIGDRAEVLNYNAKITDIRRLELWFRANHIFDWDDWAYNNIKSWSKYVRNGYSNMYQEIWWKKNSEISYNEWREENLKNQISYSHEFKRRLILNKLKLFSYSGGNIFNDNLSVFEEDDEYGFIDANGNIIIDVQFDSARQFHNGLAAVKVNGEEFNQYIPEIDDYLTFKHGGQWGFIDTKGTFIIQPQYDILTPFVNGIGAYCKGGILKKFGDTYISDNGKWGIISEEGKELIPPTYDFIRLIGNGISIASVGGKRDSVNGVFYGGSWCVLSKDGDKLTPFKYTWIFDFENGKAVVNVGGVREDYDGNYYWNGEWGYIDEKGCEIEPLKEYCSIEDFKGGFEDTY